MPVTGDDGRITDLEEIKPKYSSLNSSGHIKFQVSISKSCRTQILNEQREE